MKRFLTILFLILSLVTPVMADIVEMDEKTSYGAAEFLSEGIWSDNICRGLSSYEDGKPIIVVVVEGSEGSLLQVIDVNADKILRSFNCGTSGTMWQGAVAPDGTVYCAVKNHLIIYSPETKTITDAGTVPTTWSGGSSQLVVGDNGVLYGGAYRYASVYQYKDNQISTLATLPNVLDVSGVAYHSGYLWAGGDYNGEDGGGTYLYRIDPATGSLARAKNPLPNSEKIKSIGMMYTCGDYIIVQLEGMTTPMHGYFYHPASNRWLQESTGNYKILDFRANGMTDICQNQRFYIPPGSTYYHGINIETLSIRMYTGMGKWGYQRGNGLPIQCDYFEGDCFAQIQYNGNLSVISPTENKAKGLSVRLNQTKIPRRITRVASDGRVYVTGFMGSYGIAYNPETNESESFRVGQGEGMVEYNNKMYIGVYPGATITEFDMTKEVGDESKCKQVLDIEDDQDRPFGMDVADGKLLIGTIPTSGNLGGALTIMDLETYESQTYRNLVQEHGILTVTHKDNIVYFGTSAGQGGGVAPAEDNRIAHVVAFDLNTREIVKDVKFTIPGVAENVGAVHGLRISPYDGKLYGTTAGIDFVMNPDTLAIERYHIYSSDRSVATGELAQLWHEHYMQFYNGYLFRTNAILNPETLEILDTCSVGQLAGVYEDTAYFVDSNTDIYKADINQYIPDTQGIVWDFDNKAALPDYFVYNNKSVYTAALPGASGNADDASFRFITGIGKGCSVGENPIQKWSNGFNILEEKIGTDYLNDTTVAVSVDFQTKTNLLRAHLINPTFHARRDLFYGCVSLAQTKVYAGGQVIGTAKKDEWHNVSAVYRLSSTGATTYDVYFDEKLVAENLSVEDANTKKGISDFRILIAADVDETVSHLERYDARNEYLLIDNLYIGYNEDNVGQRMSYKKTASGISLNGGAYGGNVTVFHPEYDKTGRLSGVSSQKINLLPRTTTVFPTENTEVLIWNGMQPLLEATKR